MPGCKKGIYLSMSDLFVTIWYYRVKRFHQKFENPTKRFFNKIL